jgi:hypothetical protein
MNKITLLLFIFVINTMQSVNVAWYWFILFWVAFWAWFDSAYIDKAKLKDKNNESK